ncbi:MAG TPA: EVE domain-containing protein [Acetobacteraceae bacterium]|nr:EVE domain-containing protein [Acetobacteraceae bacterium]
MTGRRHYWLVKSEPEAFSWDQQVANGVEPWSGVRNHAAKNNLKAMRVGDRAFFYHSNTGKEIVGVVEVARTAYPDPTAEAGDWVAVDMRAVGPMPRPIGLAAIKADPAFADLALVRQSRLSVLPVSAAHWAALCRMGGWD